uniref:Uncharacterized protein n=1 Tax=Tetranychus urticae TaxID=32264 RepID=T1JVF6_TETUR
MDQKNGSPKDIKLWMFTMVKKLNCSIETSKGRAI